MSAGDVLAYAFSSPFLLAGLFFVAAYWWDLFGFDDDDDKNPFQRD